MATKIAELKCCRCRLRLPIERFYKAARKRDEPECIRCTSWASAAEPDVVPPALESGHVSIEEIRGDDPEQTGFGAEMRELHRGIDERDLQALNRLNQSTSSESEGGAPLSSGPPSTFGAASTTSGLAGLPAHLTSYSASGSEASWDTDRPISTAQAPSRAMSVVSAATSRLPAHLGGGGRAESVSTATTFREVRAAGATPFNRWDEHGNQRPGFKPATTISSMTSESGRSEWSTQTRPVTNEGGGAFPKPDRREKYKSEFTPHIRTQKAHEQIKEDRVIGFCNDNEDFEYSDDDWQ